MSDKTIWKLPQGLVWAGCVRLILVAVLRGVRSYVGQAGAAKNTDNRHAGIMLLEELNHLKM